MYYMYVLVCIDREEKNFESRGKDNPYGILLDPPVGLGPHLIQF